MALYEVTSQNLAKISQTTFDQAGLRERDDLQRLLKRQIEIIAPDTLIIAEEFGEWEESKRRIDLLGLDKDANLVVIELKRTEEGGHMELQAIRYAAMVSTMTFDRVVDVYSRYLVRENQNETDARAAILEFLGWASPDEDAFAQDVRIVLASSNFSKELTTAVMWLNKRDLDVRCVRVIPYQDNGRILVDVQQVIPLPEAVEYQIQIREKEQKERKERVDRLLLPRFWQSLLTLGKDKTALHAKMSPSERSYMGAGSGVGGLNFYYTVSPHANRVYIYFSRANALLNKKLFDNLFSHKEQIEAAFGEPLSWQRLDSKVACRIDSEMANGGYKEDEANWQATQFKMINTMIRFEKAFAPFIANLK